MWLWLVVPVLGIDPLTEILRSFLDFILLLGFWGDSRMRAATEGTTNMSLYLSVARECMLARDVPLRWLQGMNFLSPCDLWDFTLW